MENIKAIVDFRGKTPKKLGLTWSKSGYLALSAQNVKNGYIDKNIDTHYGDQILYDKWMAGKDLHKGQVIFTTEAPMGNVAQIPDDNKYILSQRTIAFVVDTNEISEDFLSTLLRSSRTFNKLSALASGGTAKGISQKSLSGLKLFFPKAYNEQQKIGSFFSHLDELITLHQRMLDEYKTLKKTMLSKMFPKNSEKYPELRFSGFTDAWELRKLGEIAKITTGKLDANAMDQDGIYDFYTSGIKKYHINSYSFEGPAITIAGNGATVGYMHLADGKFDAYQRTYVLTDFDGNRQYLFENIGLKLPKKIKQESRTGNIPYIVLDMLTKLLIDYPSINEQQKIGSFFKYLDELITLHQRELELLKTLKKTMLQQMFV